MTADDALPELVHVFPTDDGGLFFISLDLDLAWSAMEVIQQAGMEHALKFAAFVTAVNQATWNPRAPETPEEHAAQAAFVRASRQNLAVVIQSVFDGTPHYDAIEDRVLAFTHQLLVHKLISWDAAARFAAAKLGQPITSTAWRLRLTRWAERKGKARVALDKGRPRKRST